MQWLDMQSYFNLVKIPDFIVSRGNGHALWYGLFEVQLRVCAVGCEGAHSAYPRRAGQTHKEDDDWITAKQLRRQNA